MVEAGPRQVKRYGSFPSDSSSAKNVGYKKNFPVKIFTGSKPKSTAKVVLIHGVSEFQMVNRLLSLVLKLVIKVKLFVFLVSILILSYLMMNLL